MIYNIIDSNRIKEILIHGIKEVSSHDEVRLKIADSWYLTSFFYVVHEKKES